MTGESDYYEGAGNRGYMTLIIGRMIVLILLYIVLSLGWANDWFLGLSKTCLTPTNWLGLGSELCPADSTVTFPGSARSQANKNINAAMVANANADQANRSAAQLRLNVNAARANRNAAQATLNANGEHMTSPQWNDSLSSRSKSGSAFEKMTSPQWNDSLSSRSKSGSAFEKMSSKNSGGSAFDGLSSAVWSNNETMCGGRERCGDSMNIR